LDNVIQSWFPLVLPFKSFSRIGITLIQTIMIILISSMGCIPCGFQKQNAIKLKNWFSFELVKDVCLNCNKLKPDH